MVRKKYLKPYVAFLALWGGALLFIESGVIQYVALSTEFYYVIFSGFLFYVLGYSFYSPKHLNSNSGELKFGKASQLNISTDNAKKLIVRIFFSAVGLQIIILVYNLVKFTGLSFDMALYRSLLTDQGQRPDFFFAIILLNPFCYLITIVAVAFGRSKKLIIVSIVMSILFAILATGRSNLLVIGLLTIWFLYFKRRLSYGTAFALLGGFSFFFFLMGLFQGKIVEDIDYQFMYVSSSIPRNLLGLSFVNLASYATSGIVAMSEYVSSSIPYYDFYLTANNFYKLFSILFSEIPEYGILPNAFVPFPTNVYSSFFPPYADWGLFGVCVVFFAYGIIGAWLFNNFERHQSDYNRILLSLYYTILTLSVFHDYVFSSIFPYTIVVLLIICKKKINQADGIGY